MDTEHIQRVIHLQQFLQARSAPQTDHTAHQTDDDGTAHTHETSSGGNRDQTRYRTRSSTQHRWLAFDHPLGSQPGQRCSGGSNPGIHEGQRSSTTGFQGRTGVETEPAEPQQRGTDHGEGQVVRRHGFTTVTNPLASDVSNHQTRHSGVNVHHRTTGKVERALLEQIACGCTRCFSGFSRSIGIRTGPEPHHVGNREVGQRKPGGDAEQYCRELDTFSPGTHDQRTGNGSKRTLEDHEGQLGNRDTFREGTGQRITGNALQQDLVERAKEGVIQRMSFSKSDAIAIDHPQQTDQGKHHKHLDEQRQHVLLANQTAVEEGQTRDRHQDNKCGTNHDPGVIGLVHHRLCRRWFCQSYCAGQQRKQHCEIFFHE